MNDRPALSSDPGIGISAESTVGANAGLTARLASRTGSLNSAPSGATQFPTADREAGRESAHVLGKVASGIRWSVLDQGVQQVVRLGVMVVLTKLLSPSEFGLMNMAWVAVLLLSLVYGLGLGEALIQRRDINERHVAVAFTATMAMGVLIAIVTSACSGLIAGFFREPGLQPVLACLSLVVVFQGLEAVPNEMLRKGLHFRDCVISNTIGTVIGGAVALLCGLGGAGVWSLVGLALTESVVAAALSWWLAIRAGVWRPALSTDRRALGDLIGFSTYVIGQQALWYTQNNVDNLIVGRVLGATALGLYGLAYRVLLYPLQRLTAVLSMVGLPVFSSLSSDRARLREAFLTSLSYAALVSFPLTLGAALVAREFVPLILGEQWLPAVTTLQILALNGPRLALKRLFGDVYQAVGKPQWDFWSTGLTLVAYVPAFLIGVRHGIAGVAVGLTIAGYLVAPLDLRLAARAVGTRIGGILRAMLPASLATLVMSFVVLCGRLLLPDEGWLALRLTCLVAAGTVVYASALRVCAPGLLSGALRDVRRRSAGASPA
jgi:O-antigen/teichoic acid export membrane protein